MRGLLVVSKYESIRMLRKKSLYLFILLALLPLPVAVLLRSLFGERIEAGVRLAERLGVDYSRMWAVLLGIGSAPPQLAEIAGLFNLLGVTSLAGFVWLVAILLGGDLLAGDLRDKLLHLVVIRPVRRAEYIAAKLIVVTLELVILFAITGLVAYASMQVLIGGQAAPHEAVGFAVLLGLSALPLLLTSSALGAAFRNPTLGMVLGLVVYFASAVVAALAAAFAAGLGAGNATAPAEQMARMVKLSYELQAYNPFSAGGLLARCLYAQLHEEGVIRVPVVGAPGGAVEIDAGGLASIAVLVFTASVLLLALVNWVLVARRDL